MIKLEWKTAHRKVNDLLPFEINPRKISEVKLKKLQGYIEQFNVVEIPVINFDNTLITWHQRLKVMQLIGRGDELIDVRVPNRQLSKKELKEYNIIANTHSGEFDIDILTEDFSDIELGDFDIETSNKKLTQTFDFENGKFDGKLMKYPVTIILDFQEYKQWEKLKEEFKEQSDNKLFFKLTELKKSKRK